MGSESAEELRTRASGREPGVGGQVSMKDMKDA